MNKKIIYKATILLGFKRNDGLPKLEIICAEINRKHGWRLPDEDAPKAEKRRKYHMMVKRYCQAQGLLPSNGVGGLVKDPRAYVYILQQNGGGKCIKIGYTTNKESRYKSLKTGSPYSLHEIACINAEDERHARYIEHALHNGLKKYRME